MHVPLILKFPGNQKKNRFPQLAGLIDIMPTLLDFSHIPYKGLQGESLLPEIDGGPAQSHPVFSTLKETGTFKADNITLRNSAYSYFSWDRFQKSMLFNRNSDRRETENLAIRAKGISTKMLQSVRQYFQLNYNIRNRMKQPNARVQQSEETQKRLKSLGYLN